MGPFFMDTMKTDIKDQVSAYYEGFTGETLTLAASLAYVTLLSVVPLVTVVFSTLSLFPVFAEWSEAVEQFIFSNFVPASGEVINDWIQKFRGQAGSLTAIGLVTLLITSLMLLTSIENALNKIWDVKEGRRFSQRLLVYWTLLTLTPILLVASLAFSSTILTSALLTRLLAEIDSAVYVVSILPFIFEWLTFSLLYFVLPNRDTHFSYAAIGALVTTILFEISKFGFAWYVNSFDSFTVIYGAFGVIPIFLIWIYISWLVILAGARYAAWQESVNR